MAPGPLNHQNCYVDGQPCDCGAFDVTHDGCPRDEYAHEEDQDYSDADLDEQIEAEYLSRTDHDDEIARF